MDNSALIKPTLLFEDFVIFLGFCAFSAEKHLEHRAHANCLQEVVGTAVVFQRCLLFQIPNKHFVLLLQLNPNVSVFQRKYVNEVKKCEEMERILGELYFNVCPFSPVVLLECHYSQLQVFLTFPGFVSCEIYLH